MNYISAIKDILIVAAVAYLIWFIDHAQHNADEVKALQAVQQQLLTNVKTEERYQSEINDAFAENHSQLGAITASIDANRKPVIVYVPKSGGTVPGTPANPPGGVTSPGGSGEQVGTDIRSNLNSYEDWLEGSFATCRALRDAWPH